MSTLYRLPCCTRGDLYPLPLRLTADVTQAVKPDAITGRRHANMGCQHADIGRRHAKRNDHGPLVSQAGRAAAARFLTRTAIVTSRDKHRAFQPELTAVITIGLGAPSGSFPVVTNCH